jgi:hypothetical protein
MERAPLPELPMKSDRHAVADEGIIYAVARDVSQQKERELHKRAQPEAQQQP